MEEYVLYSCLALTTWSSVWETYHTTGGVEAVPSKLLEVIRISGNQFKKIIPLMGGLHQLMDFQKDHVQTICLSWPRKTDKCC